MYSNIPEVKFSLQVSRQLSVRSHLWRHFLYISRAKSFERDQFRINGVSLCWDIGMLRQKQYYLGFSYRKCPLERFYRRAHARYWVRATSQRSDTRTCDARLSRSGGIPYMLKAWKKSPFAGFVPQSGITDSDSAVRPAVDALYY